MHGQQSIKFDHFHLFFYTNVQCTLLILLPTLLTHLIILIYTYNTRLAIKTTDGFPPWRPTFSPRPVHVGFVVDKVAMGQIFYEYFSFPLSVSFHQCSILIYLSPMLHNFLKN